MDTIDYFKLQAKNLYRDYKSKIIVDDKQLGISYYEYEPKFFKIETILSDFEIDEDHFSLMNAQHIIAQLVGFTKWTEMLKASNSELELCKLIFDNMDKISAEEWREYILGVESENDVTFDVEGRLDIFKEVFANVDGHQSFYADYRRNKNRKPAMNVEQAQVESKKPSAEITSLPLSAKDRTEFIKVANVVFEKVIERIEPHNPVQLHKLWDVEDYVDNLLGDEMLPISRDYALSLIDAFLVHHVVSLAAEADQVH